MADRVVVMRAGVIEQVDSPVALYERPRNKFVASFIGSPGMNFLNGSIIDGRFRIGDQSLALTSEDVERIGERRKVIFGIRPEHFRTSADAAKFVFQCDVIEPLGSHTLLLGQIENQKITAQVDSRFEAIGNSQVNVEVDMTQAHFFDPDSEERL